MSRPVTDLLPDVRVAAAGVPQMLATYHLTRALGEFLDRSEAWRDWSTTTLDYEDATNGLASWINHTNQPTQRWMRLKRIDKLRWTDDGQDIPFKTQDQLQQIDPLWRTRTGNKPVFYTHEGELAAAGANPSGFQIRIYPAPEAGVTGSIQPRFVIVTDTVADFGLNSFDAQIPQIPDRIFYPFRNVIVSGALRDLYLLPAKDWTDQKLSAAHGAAFQNGCVDAKSRADRDFGNAPLVIRYGGI